MRIPVRSSQFKRDFKKMKSRGKDMSILKQVVDLLINEIQLPEQYHDHQLKGEWQLYRELHIEPDWLLIYRIMDDGTVHFGRTGSHADIF